MQLFTRRRGATAKKILPSRRGRAAAGFTLAEVMTAVLVMAFVISTSITTLESGFQSIDMARNTTLAGQILQSLVEDLRMTPWSSGSGYTGVSVLPATLTGPVSTFDATGSFSVNPTAAAMLARFTITRTVSDVSGQAGLKVIVFTAQWTGIDRRSHSAKYTTYYAQSGLYDYYFN